MIHLLIPVVASLVDKLFPDPAEAAAAKLNVMQMAQRGELAEMEAEVKLVAGQIDINKVEAAHPSIFVSGWRPAVGWVCVAGLAYTFLGRPLMVWATPLLAAATGVEVPIPPALNLGDLITLLGGMLGLGGLRTYEKARGVARK